MSKRKVQTYEATGAGNIRASDSSETEVTLLRKPWLSRPGVSVSLGRLFSWSRTTDLYFSCTLVPVLSEDNPILETIRCGSLLRLRQLIGEGRARPSK